MEIYGNNAKSLKTEKDFALTTRRMWNKVVSQMVLMLLLFCKHRRGRTRKKGKVKDVYYSLETLSHTFMTGRELMCGAFMMSEGNKNDE